MAWDIYGDRLEKGHCEVHPHIHEEYPCFLCIQQQKEYAEDIAAQREYYRYLEEQYQFEMHKGYLGESI